MTSSPSTEQLQAAIAILGSGESAETSTARIEGLVNDPMLANRLATWIPEVFGLVLVSHLGKVHLPKSFSAKSATGNWQELDLSLEPIFGSALPLAAAMFHSGPRDVFENLATRSAVVNAANNLLNAGSHIDGATLSGPALIGIPAEVYTKAPWWRRVFK